MWQDAIPGSEVSEYLHVSKHDVYCGEMKQSKIHSCFGGILLLLYLNTYANFLVDLDYILHKSYFFIIIGLELIYITINKIFFVTFGQFYYH